MASFLSALMPRARPAAPSVANDSGASTLNRSAEVLELILAESARRLPDPPRTPATPAPQAATVARAEAPAPSGPIRVLLAEDHPVNRKVVELILASIGADITCVENGQLAVEAFRTARFDIVLMDMQMPVMDGLTATREIRALETADGRVRTPILSLTANAMPEHVEASFAAGADDHLTKPVNANSLVAAVEAATRAAPSEAARRSA